MSAGQILTGATSTNDLSQEVFLEVKEAFDRVNIFQPLVENKTIENGSSAQFVIGGKDSQALALTQGRSGADTATGTDISVNAINMDERIVTINDLIYDARRIDGKEEKIAHYDVRSPVTSMIGTVLAQKIDFTILEKLGACVGEAGLAGNPAGAAAIVNTVIASGSSAKEKGDALAESIFEAVATLKENDVYGEPVVAVSPMNYAYLVQSGNGVNADYTSGNGGFDSGSIMMVAGAKVVQTNHLTAAIGNGTTADIEGIEAMVFTSEAVGFVSLMGLMTESNYDFNKFATLISGRYAIGCDVLRPECAVAIASASQV
jgi:hypothetical protein